MLAIGRKTDTRGGEGMGDIEGETKRQRQRQYRGEEPPWVFVH